MPRIFVYDGREFPDPDGGLTVEEVKTNLASFMPELANATVTQTQRDGNTIIHFNKRVGTKGSQ